MNVASFIRNLDFTLELILLRINDFRLFFKRCVIRTCCQKGYPMIKKSCHYTKPTVVYSYRNRERRFIGLWN